MNGTNAPAVEGRYSVPTRMKVGYGFGDFALNLLLMATSLYLLYFYTDVFGISASLAGVIFLVSKLWNAAIDPFIGYWIDHTKSRWGQKRPFMLFGAIPLALCFYLIFSNPHLSATMRFIYGLATFLLFNTLFAIVSVPYLALTASLTQDSHERSVITGYRMMFTIPAIFVASGATKPLVKLFPNEAIGYKAVGLIYGVLAAVIILLSLASFREPPEDIARERDKSMGNNLRSLSKNSPFIILATSVFLSSVAVYTVSATVNYFFKYNLAREDLIPLAFSALFGASIVSIPFWLYFSKKTGKKLSLIAGLIAICCSLFIAYNLENITIPQLFAVLCAVGFGMSSHLIYPYAMLADTVEYSEWKTRVRHEGFLYGFYIFGLKLAQAFAGFFSGFILDLFRYAPNVAQTEESLFGIRLLMFLIPCFFIVLAAALLAFYPINSKMHRRMVSEIEQRNAGSSIIGQKI